MLFFYSPLLSKPYEFFVSPAGSDTNIGSREAPFKTLAKACEAAINNKTNDSITILLSGGIYKIDKPVTLTSRPSGSENPLLVIKSMSESSGQMAILCGGVELKPSLSRTCLKEDFKAGINRRYASKIRKWTFKDVGVSDTAFWSMANIHNSVIPQLFWGDKRMPLARWPNDTFARIDSVLVNRPVADGSAKGDTVGDFICRSIPRAALKKWAKETDHAFLHGYWFWDWYDNIELFDSINTSSAVIKTKVPYNGYGYRKGQRFYAANLLCELDREGEWCVDPKRKLIYFWPPVNGKNESAWLTVNTGGLISLSKASNITFSGLEFMASINGLVTGTACTTITFENCVFKNTGGNGLTLSRASDCSITGCEFAEIGKTAIAVSGGVRKNLIPSNIKIVNNRIHDFGQVKRTNEPAVRIADDAVGCVVEENTMYNAPECAIVFMGNNHCIANNYIYSVCTEVQDDGVLYTGRDWTARGTIIRNNLIENCGSGDVNAVYLDDMASGIDCEGNCIRNVPRAFKIGGGRDDIVRNNTIANTGTWLAADNRGLNWGRPWVQSGGTLSNRLSATPYKDSIWSAAYPGLVPILDDDPGCPKGNVVTGNILVNAGKANIAPEVKRYGIIENNIVSASANTNTTRYGVKNGLSFRTIAPLPQRRMPVVPLVKKIAAADSVVKIVLAQSYFSGRLKAQLSDGSTGRFSKGPAVDTVSFDNMKPGTYSCRLWYGNVFGQDSLDGVTDTVAVGASPAPEKQGR